MENFLSLEHLVCPKCKSNLTLLNNKRLFCKICNLNYPIINNIPNFLIEDLKNETRKEKEYWNNKVEINNEHLYENLESAEFYKLLHLFNIKENTVGLELGCGDGPFARRLINKNLHIYGTDISHTLLKFTKNLFPVQANALELPFRTNFFDWIIYAFALHHMVDMEKAVKEAVRCLKPGGSIYIIEPNYYHPIRFLTRNPNTFFRKYIFKYFSPEEAWISTKKLKKFLRFYNVRVNKVFYFTPKFKNPSFLGKIQYFIGKTLNFKILHSYYFLEGIKK